MSYLIPYIPIGLVLVAGLVFGIANLILGRLVGPQRVNPSKQMPYESGMDPVGDARQPFDVKFYVVAILFLVFDVELLFLYPWAVTAYSTWGNPPSQIFLKNCAARCLP